MRKGHVKGMPMVAAPHGGAQGGRMAGVGPTVLFKGRVFWNIRRLVLHADGCSFAIHASGRLNTHERFEPSQMNGRGSQEIMSKRPPSPSCLSI